MKYGVLTFIWFFSNIFQKSLVCSIKILPFLYNIMIKYCFLIFLSIELLWLFFFFFLQLLSFISPPCKGWFEFSSIPLLSLSPPSDQILQAPDPGWQELKQLSESIRSALNPPEEGSTSQTRRQLHLKLGAAQRQASQRGQRLRQLAAEPGWMEPHDDKHHLCLYRVT